MRQLVEFPVEALPAGRTFIGAGPKGGLVIWTEPAQVFARPCSLADRQPSEDERQRCIGDTMPRTRACPNGDWRDWSIEPYFIEGRYSCPASSV